MTGLQGKALIFDVDATLVDTEKAIDDIWRVWSKRHNQDFCEIYPHIHGRKVLETLASINIKFSNKQHELEVEQIAIEKFSHSKAINGALAFVRSLPTNSWGIATSGAKVVASTSLQSAGFILPEVMVCSEDVKYGKPDPEPFALAAKRLGFKPEECIAFEDSPVGIRSAKLAGCKVIALTTSHSAEEISDADLIISDFEQLTYSKNEIRYHNVLNLVS
jgi:sugar-phosphatase